MTVPASSSESPALALLAGHAQEITIAAAPEPVRRQARLCILDTVGCMIAGTRTDEARLILQCEPLDDGTTVTVPGTAHRRSLAAAIRVNGYLGDVLELNDLIGGHASIGNVTAALALAEAGGESGAALLEAVMRGIEVTARVYGAVYPALKRFTEVGLVPVGIPSSIGSAAAASRLLKLDVERTFHAMAIAGSLAGWCPAEVVFGDGGTVKPMLFGAQPGATGATAAFYARQGMKGPPRLLESKLGYFATSSNHPRLDDAPWREAWALARPRRKLHACCGYLHSAVDAMGKLRAEVGHAIEDGAITVYVPPYVADVVSKEAPPFSSNDARFHLQYCLALVMCGEEVIQPEHSIEFGSYLAKPEVVRAQGRIRVVAAPALTHYHQCRVAIDLGGRVLREQSISAPRGSPDEPLTDEEVVDKFLRLATPVIGAGAAQRFAAAVTELDGIESVRDLMSMVALPPDTGTRRPAGASPQ